MRNISNSKDFFQQTLSYVKQTPYFQKAKKYSKNKVGIKYFEAQVLPTTKKKGAQIGKNQQQATPTKNRK